MAIPDFQSLMLPMLEMAADGNEHSLGEARETLAKHFDLGQQEREELLPSGRQRRFDNRVAWSKVYLQRAGLIEGPRRAHFKISERGRAILGQKPERVDIALLDQFEEFRTFRSAEGSATAEGQGDPSSAAEDSAETPEERLEQAYQNIRAEVASELLSKVKSASPHFFEKLVVEMLLKMGYGRNRSDAGRAIGGTGDEGVDGIISEDRLGLDNIYIQAKRWEATVGRPEIQRFVGALHGKRAHKGVFITTGSFSSDAREYVSRIDPKVVLIDGRELAEYMLDLGVGVSTKAEYEIRRIDSDYFVEE